MERLRAIRVVPAAHRLRRPRITQALHPGYSSPRAQEHERAAELQRAGHWLHLWRVAGTAANVSLFKVGSPEELHTILEALPLRPYMETEVTALCRHPGALPGTD